MKLESKLAAMKMTNDFCDFLEMLTDHDETEEGAEYVLGEVLKIKYRLEKEIKAELKELENADGSVDFSKLKKKTITVDMKDVNEDILNILKGKNEGKVS